MFVKSCFLHKMETSCIQYKCKSGQTLLLYDKVTGQFQWPTKCEQVINKEFCTIGTQTDDIGCINGCTSMYISSNSYIVNTKETSTQEMPDIVDEVRGNLNIESDSDDGLDDGEMEEESTDMVEVLDNLCWESDDNNNNVEGNHISCVHGSDDHTYCKKRNIEASHLDNPIETGDSVESDDNSFQRDNIELIQEKQCFQEQLQVHGMKKFKCDECEEAFICKYLLERHVVRLHAYERSFECSYCKKKCSSQKYLNKHIQTSHIRIKHQTSHIRTKHQRSHIRTKTFECSYCKKKFARDHVFKDHLRMHTGEKPFECFICKKKYRHKNTLRDHLIKHTGERNFECPYCNKKFELKQGLNAHIKRKHIHHD